MDNLSMIIALTALLLNFSACAVLPLTINILDPGGDSNCNRDGESCQAGYYCYEKCRVCSPCPDANTYYIPNNQLFVIRECVDQGMCPNICNYLPLEPHEQANQSLCTGVLGLGQGCKLECDNGGTLDTEACRCLCSDNWSGTTCAECGLSCLHGGTLDASDCRCSCDKGWAGNNCSECGLSCLHGGTLDASDCRCTCDRDWTGNNCSDCKLKSCDNGGTLDTEACGCLCSDNWSGTNCAECGLEVCENGGTLDLTLCQCLCDEDATGDGCAGGDSPTKTVVTEEYTTTIAVICAVVGVVCVIGVIFLVRKFGCNSKPSSSDIEAHARLMKCDMTVECPTPRSIKVQATNPSRKLKGKMMKFFCLSTESSLDPKLSEPKVWDEPLLYTFEGLHPGVTYTIALLQYRDPENAVKTVEATTPYYPLLVEVNVVSAASPSSAISAAIRGLKDLHVNTLEVCPCVVLPSCKKWITIPSESDEHVLSNVPPGFEFVVKAGVVDNTQLPSQQKFRCFAQGRIDTQDITHQNLGTSSCTTVETALKSFHLKKSLQIEFDSKNNTYLAEMVAQALELDDENRKVITVASAGRHVDRLEEILSSRQSEIDVHVLIEGLLCLEDMHKTKQRKESEEFLIKLVGYTWTEFGCLECIRMLHQGQCVSSTSSV